MIRKITLPLLILLILACSVRYYAEFSEPFYMRLIDLRENTTAFFDRLEYDQAYLDTNYQTWQGFYEGFYVDLESLYIQASVIPYNNDTVKMLGLLKDSMESVERLHIKGFSKAEHIRLARSGIMAHFSALLALEEAKKREDE